MLDQQGDTSNDEQECYEPGQVSERSSALTITSVYSSSGFTCPSGTPSNANCTGAWHGQLGRHGTLPNGGAARVVHGVYVRDRRGKAEFPAHNDRSTWPAIWLLGAACQTSSTSPDTFLSGTSSTATGYFCPWSGDSSDSAEIDITEGNSGTTTTVLENLFNSSSSGGHSCSSPTISDDSSNFHTFELDWSAGILNFKIDGRQTSCSVRQRRVVAPNVSHH